MSVPWLEVEWLIGDQMVTEATSVEWEHVSIREYTVSLVITGGMHCDIHKEVESRCKATLGTTGLHVTAKTPAVDCQTRPVERGD